MKKLLVLVPIFVLFMSGCSNDPVSVPVNNTEYGNVQFKIDRENAPENVQLVKAYLTRENFQTIISTMNLLSDTTADITLNDVAAGQWHLKVDALDQQNVVVYSGETDVQVLPSTTIQVTLTLMPVSQGTGNIYIFVTWGTLPPPRGWHDFINNPVIRTSQTEGNPFKVAESRVIYDGGKYKMWYNGVFSNAVSFVYYAESADGKTWIFPHPAPVLSPSIAGWDEHSVCVGAVLKEGGFYRMFYSGADHYGYQLIGMATSSDGINWEKAPAPLFQPPNGWSIGAHSAVKVNNQYYLYFGSFYTSQNIHLAVTTDLVNWTFHTNILPATQIWEGGMTHYAGVIYDAGMFKMVYQDHNYSAFGLASSQDGINWEKNSANPIFRTSNASQHWCTEIAYPNFFKGNNVTRIYYTGTNASSGRDNIAVLLHN